MNTFHLLDDNELISHPRPSIKMFEKIKAWYLRRRFHKEIDKISDAEIELDEALKATSKDLIIATREAKKRNKLIEARRRIMEIEDAQNDGEDLLDEDEEDEEDGFNAEAELMKIVRPLLEQKLLGKGMTPEAAAATAAERTAVSPDSMIKSVAHKKVDLMTDNEIMEFAKKLKK